MEIGVRHEQGRVDVTVFAIMGELTVESYEQLEERFVQEQKLGTKHLLIDLKEVPYISSNGLRALQHIFSLLEQDDETTRTRIRAGTFMSTRLKLLSPSTDVCRVLKTAGFDMFLEMYSDLQSAIASF
jgi:anti-anti-sigma factor